MNNVVHMYEDQTPHSFFNHDAEQALLGALMRDARLFDDLPSQLLETDFTVRHIAIFRAITWAITQNLEPDAITVAEKILQESNTDELGYLSELCTETVGQQVRVYAKMVMDKSLDRNLVRVAGEISKIGHEPASRDEKLAEVSRLVVGLDDEAEDTATDMNSLIKTAIYTIDKKFRNEAPTGLKTGFTDIDLKLEGIQSQDLIILAGRPSMGKTALAMNVATNVIMGGGNVLVFSLEMSKEALINRMISSVTGINSRIVRSGKLTEGDWPKLQVGMQKLKDKNLTIIDTPSLHINQIASIVRKFNRVRKVDLVVIDYLQNCKGNSKDGRVNEVADISRGLVAIKKDNNVPIIALSQLSRDVEKRTDKRPINSDLRESGQLEQDADIIIFMYRDEYYSKDSTFKGVAEANVTKNREGETGTIYLASELQYTRFTDIKQSFEPQQSEGYRYES